MSQEYSLTRGSKNKTTFSYIKYTAQKLSKLEMSANYTAKLNK